VRVTTLLIVGANDGVVMDLNRDALEQLAGEKAMVIVPGAGHLSEEPGMLAAVIGHAVRWFDAHLGPSSAGAS
jgi:pimeloyl-ACP methyl ester carboxylesterase